MLISSDTFNVWSIWAAIFAVAGAAICVVGWHAVRSRSISHNRYVPRSSY
jgi:hypothetical protein